MQLTHNRMLVNRTLTSKDTRVSPDATFFSLRDSVKPSLCLTNEKLFLQYMLKDFG